MSTASATDPRERLTREEIAQREIGRTDIAPALAWSMTVLFLLTLAAAGLGSEVHRSQLEAGLSQHVGRYDGLVLIFGGVGVIVLATTRFVRTTRLLDDAQMHAASNVRTELILSACLVVVVASYSLYLAFS